MVKAKEYYFLDGRIESTGVKLCFNLYDYKTNRILDVKIQLNRQEREKLLKVIQKSLNKQCKFEGSELK